MQYMKKPEIVEAEKFIPGMGMECGHRCFCLLFRSGECARESNDYLHSCCSDNPEGCKYSIPYLKGQGYITILNPGDYIVTNSKNERYVIPAKEFEKNYIPLGSPGMSPEEKREKAVVGRPLNGSK